MEASFNEQVDRQIQRLRSCSCRTIESEATAKRVSWFQRNCSAADRTEPPSPRAAYELLLLRYLRLSEEDVPVVAESESEIVWLSRNPCPTLEACRSIGLDTRVVCRSAYEKPAQALISEIDPQLRFLRDYDEIRPHAAHCREMIVRVDFEQMMRIALEEARASRVEGNKGYGAVVALGNRIIARAHDTATSELDPSLHAELKAIRSAAEALHDGDLTGTVLFSTCEPCPMCASLAVWANVTAIVYGASIEETARLGKSRILVGAKEIVDKSPATVEVIGGVLREECLSLYR